MAAHTVVDKAERGGELSDLLERQERGGAGGRVGEAGRPDGCITPPIMFDGEESLSSGRGGRGPLNVYGETKRAGRTLAGAKAKPSPPIFRTSWVYATRGRIL